MNERVEKSLHDILLSISEIESFFEDRPKRFDDFLSDIRTRRAVERNIEIIGEATNRILKVDPDFKLTNARQIVAMRNYVAHAYDSLTPEKIWAIVINDLTPLKAEVEALLAQ
jgi:uncharacterized protein with HEPN domain